MTGVVFSEGDQTDVVQLQPGEATQMLQPGEVTSQPTTPVNPTFVATQNYLTTPNDAAMAIARLGLSPPGHQSASNHADQNFWAAHQQLQWPHQPQQINPYGGFGRACVFFAEGICSKGDKCRFFHPPSQDKDNERGPCAFFAEGFCRMGFTCAFYHGNKSDAKGPKEPKAPHQKSSRPCAYFAQGFCKKGKYCDFAHIDPNDPQQPVSVIPQRKDPLPFSTNKHKLCQYFAKGFCVKGASCDFYHPRAGVSYSSSNSNSNSNTTSSLLTANRQPPPTVPQARNLMFP